MKSQELRKMAPEIDSLRLGSGWTLPELSKPQVIVESSYGHSHPGSAHLDRLVRKATEGIDREGGRAAHYFCTDICDGEAQGHDGMNYSLVSRDIMAAMMEIHVRATPFDAGVFIASCQVGAGPSDGHRPTGYACPVRAGRRDEGRPQFADVGTDRNLQRPV